MTDTSKKTPRPAFHLGDRVEYRVADRMRGCTDIDGCTGTVVYIDGSACHYTVKLDAHYAGAVTEERAGHYAVPNCWFCRAENLVPVGPRKDEKKGVN